MDNGMDAPFFTGISCATVDEGQLSPRIDDGGIQWKSLRQ
jgi:hypothetical protein